MTLLKRNPRSLLTLSQPIIPSPIKTKLLDMVKGLVSLSLMYSPNGFKVILLSTKMRNLQHVVFNAFLVLKYDLNMFTLMVQKNSRKLLTTCSFLMILQLHTNQPRTASLNVLFAVPKKELHVLLFNQDSVAVSYTHLTLPTTPYV